MGPSALPLATPKARKPRLAYSVILWVPDSVISLAFLAFLMTICSHQPPLFQRQDRRMLHSVSRATMVSANGHHLSIGRRSVTSCLQVCFQCRLTVHQNESRCLGTGSNLGGTLHNAHHLSTLDILDDSNGILVYRVEGNELGALIVIPQSVLVLVTLSQHLQATKLIKYQSSQARCTAHLMAFAERDKAVM